MNEAECYICGWFYGHAAWCSQYVRESNSSSEAQDELPDLVDLLKSDGWTAVDVTDVAAGGLEAIKKKMKRGGEDA